MKVLGKIVVLAAGIPLLVGAVVTVAVLFMGACTIVFWRRTLQLLGRGDGGGSNLANPSAPSTGA